MYKCANMQLIVAKMQILVYGIDTDEERVKLRKRKEVKTLKDAVSILLLTHGKLGEELMRSASMILGEIPNVKALSLMPGMSIEEFFEAADQAVAEAQGETVVMTDLFGGTPNNVAMMLRQKYPIRVLCGANMPMLIELVNSLDITDEVEDAIKQALDTARLGILEPDVCLEDEEGGM